MARTKAPRRARVAKPPPPTPETFQWSDPEQARELAHLYNNCVAFDTETTGLTEVDEIAEIALVRVSTREVIYETYVKPGVPFHPDVVDPYGKFRFDPENCRHAPSWAEVEPRLRAALGSLQLVCWAGGKPDEMVYDRRMIDQSRQGVLMSPLDPADLPVLNLKPFHTSVRRAKYKGLSRPKGEGGLSRALRAEGLRFDGQEHTARVDALAVADLIRLMWRLQNDEIGADEALARALDDALLTRLRARRAQHGD